MPDRLDPAPPRPAPGGAFAAQFGLDADESALLGRLLARALEGMGLAGERIAGRLSDGKLLHEALDVPAGTIDLLYAHAHRWFGVGRADRAERLFRALCVLAGEPDHWVGYGVCLAMRGADREAADALHAAARLRPGWAIPHFHLAGLALRAGREDEAARHLDAFDSAALPAPPPEIRAEADRMRHALALRRGGMAARLRS